MHYGPIPTLANQEFGQSIDLARIHPGVERNISDHDAVRKEVLGFEYPL